VVENTHLYCTKNIQISLLLDVRTSPGFLLKFFCIGIFLGEIMTRKCRKLIFVQTFLFLLTVVYHQKTEAVNRDSAQFLFMLNLCPFAAKSCSVENLTLIEKGA
jgi:hypothetical protein